MKNSSKDALLAEIRRVGVMKTSDVLRWGIENFSNRAERNMRQLAKEGKVQRLEREDKVARFGDIKQDVWELTQKGCV